MTLRPYDRPPHARGFLPLVMAALAAGKAIYGAVNANQQKQRNKGYLSDAYRQGVQRLDVRQNDVRESTAESLNARGLLGGGYSPIHRAMGASVGSSGVNQQVPIDATTTANDLASGTALRNEREFDIERHDLDSQYQRDINENKAEGLNGEIGAIAGGIQGIGSAYATGQDMSAIAKAGAAANAANAAGGAASGSGTPIQSALLSGSAWQGIHPTNPLGDATSSWHTPNITLDGSGQTNGSFNTSGLG